MAEGDLSRTLKGGSEALFDHACSQCRDDGRTQEATDFCKNCQEFLCNTCGRYHVRNIKTHQLVSVASMSQAKTAAPTTIPVPVVAKCHYHPDQDIEMHCGTHDMVYCCRCIAKEHRSCSDVKDIADVAHQSSMSKLQSLVTDITHVSQRLHTTKLEKSKELKQLKKMKASLLDEIKTLRKKFSKQLDALEQKIIAELDKEEKMLENDISDDITTVDALIVSSDNSKPDLTSHLNGKQMFITEKLGQVVLKDANNFLRKANALKHPTLIFEPNAALCDVIEKSDRMGKIIRGESQPVSVLRRKYPVKPGSVQHTCSKYTVTCRTDINVRVQSDKQECFINNMCQLSDGNILLNDYRNNKLKRLDDQLKVKEWLDLKDTPFGLCSVSPTEVAVRLKDNTVHFISVGNSLKYQRKVSLIDFKRAENGIACCSNQLWIPGHKAVYVYSLSGSLVKKIETDSQSRRLFTEYHPAQIAVSNDDSKVYVAALGDRVIVFDKNGDVINELRDQQLNGVRCVCITEDDIVLVNGYHSRNVVVFDRGGNSLGELVSRHYMLTYPLSLCYDRQKCRLLVGYCADNLTSMCYQSTS